MAVDPDRRAREPWYSDARWARFAPLTGVLAVVLWVIAVIIVESGTDSPGDDATPDQIAAYFNENDGTIIVGGFLFCLGAAIFLWFLGTLRARLQLAEGGPGRLASIVFASGIVTAAMMMAVFAPQVGGAFVADEYDTGVDPGSAQAFWSAGDGFFVAALASVFVFYLSSGLAALRTRVLPVWLGWASFVLALAALIPPIGWATLIWGLPLWVLVASVWLFLRPAVPARREPEPLAA
jgi:hypothetical protein